MRMTVVVGLALAGMAAAAAPAGAQAASQQVTFAKDVAPILQRSCENCHRPGGGAPMSLVTYDGSASLGARPQGAGPQAREMPPWFIDKNIGIQAVQGRPVVERRRRSPRLPPGLNGWRPPG